MGISSSRQLGGAASHTGTVFRDLPKDVIVCIMFKLSLRDVVNFCLVSKQWVHISSCLDEILVGHNDIQPCPVGKKAFIKGANQFLQHYVKLQSMESIPMTLRSFVICFCLDKSSSTDIDKWINMASHRGVTSLNVALECEHHQYFQYARPNDEKYTFPWHVLEKCSTVLKSLTLCSCIFGCSLTSEWTALEFLELRLTLVGEHDMDNILKYFPNLQKFAMIYCEVPSKLTFADVSLYYLTIEDCRGVEEIKVLNCKALTEFSYRGRHVGISSNNAPKLTNVIFGSNTAEGEDYIFQNLRRDFPSMRSLSIFRDCFTLPSLSHLYGRMNSLLRLEELKLYHIPACNFSIQTMTEVLKASPILKRLEMIPPCTIDAGSNHESHVHYHHKYLKFIKISGFCGSKGQVELAKFLVRVSESLHHVVIERKVEVSWYKYYKHFARWHGKEKPEFVEDILVKLMKRGRLTFSRGICKKPLPEVNKICKGEDSVIYAYICRIVGFILNRRFL